MKPRATIACAAALLVSGSGMVMGTQSGPAPRISEAVPSVVATPTDMDHPKWEDAKDRPPAIIPLVDLTEGYLWDVPEPVVALFPVAVEPVAFAPESLPLAPAWAEPQVYSRGGWRAAWPHVRPDAWFERPTAAPEPSAWAMMLGGFGLIGVALRRVRSPS